MEFLKRVWVEIDIKALKENFKAICRKCNTPVIPVVKADAYGHGVSGIAEALQECGARMFAVSNVLEAVELRNCGINGDILILGYTPDNAVSLLLEYDITQCIYSYDYALLMSESARGISGKIKSHLKLDTGMGRIGFDCRNGGEEIESALRLKGLDFTGVFTHFASADSNDTSDIDFTAKQYNSFVKTVELLENKGISFKMKHCCNSAGLWAHGNMCMDAVRAGIILYGLAPSAEIDIGNELSPVMSMYSAVSMVKTVQAGDTVSYGRIYTADKKRRIATVTAGYADGIPRLLSNNGFVIVNGKKAPIAGRVCMDQFCVDVTDIENVEIGDTVEIFGKNLSVDMVADAADTINYEIICGISKRVPRILIKD